MVNVQLPPARCRFGVFEVDPASGELRKQGRKVRLTEQSFQILLALLERPGEVVTRQQLQERLWQGNTFVDFDANLNTAVSLLRDALGDSAKSPRFIETLPRRGYRFVGNVGDGAVPPPATPNSFVNRGVLLALSGVAALMAGGLSYLYVRAPAEALDSVAVLPLVYAGPEAGGDHQYLADGLTSALITELARLGVPNVISKTSVMQYKHTRKALPAIGRELGADVLVEGTVLREGNIVRVNAQLVDARSDKHLWAQSYQRELTSILQLQEEIARAIVREIRPKLEPELPTRRAAPQSVNAAAHEAYLKGRYALGDVLEERRSKSREFFEAAIRLDPSFAPAYEGLADYYRFTDALPPAEAFAHARRYALKALELDPALGGAHLSLALASWWGDWDWPATEREFQRSLELDPHDAAARRWYALYLDLTGRSRASFVQLQRVRELEPASPETYYALSHHFFLARRYDEAIQQARTFQEMNPHDPRVAESLGTFYVFTGAYHQAIALNEKGIALWGRDPAFIVALATAHARAGARDKATALLAELHDVARKRYIPPFFFAAIHLDLGDADRAFEWLEKAFQSRDGYLVHLKVSPQFDAVRGDARYQNLLARMKFPQVVDLQ